MPERSADWLKQAKRDLEVAKAQMKTEFFEWSCFAAQQAAEKSVKAVLQKLGAEAWGHSISDLLRGIKEKLDIPDDLIESAQQLDKFYLLSRYPNSWASGIPGDYITKKDADDAIGHSEKIIQFCSNFLAK